MLWLFVAARERLCTSDLQDLWLAWGRTLTKLVGLTHLPWLKTGVVSFFPGPSVPISTGQMSQMWLGRTNAVESRNLRIPKYYIDSTSTFELTFVANLCAKSVTSVCSLAWLWLHSFWMLMVHRRTCLTDWLVTDQLADWLSMHFLK